MKGLACRVDNLQRQRSKQVAITGELTEVLQMHDKFLPNQKNPSACNDNMNHKSPGQQLRQARHNGVKKDKAHNEVSSERVVM
jgi:hypothetical protein